MRPELAPAGSPLLLVPAMRELGYTTDADRITGSMLLAVDRHGLREHYNPLSEVGLGAHGFAFSALIVDLLAQSGNRATESARTSAGARMMRT
jgi:hypothetical protein